MNHWVIESFQETLLHFIHSRYWAINTLIRKSRGLIQSKWCVLVVCVVVRAGANRNHRRPPIRAPRSKRFTNWAMANRAKGRHCATTTKMFSTLLTGTLIRWTSTSTFVSLSAVFQNACELIHVHSLFPQLAWTIFVFWCWATIRLNVSSWRVFSWISFSMSPSISSIAIPYEIDNLVHLERLNLFNNQISELPSSVWNLKNLRQLNVGWVLLGIHDKALTDPKPFDQHEQSVLVAQRNSAANRTGNSRFELQLFGRPFTLSRILSAVQFESTVLVRQWTRTFVTGNQEFQQLIDRELRLHKLNFLMVSLLF